MEETQGPAMSQTPQDGPSSLRGAYDAFRNLTLLEEFRRLRMSLSARDYINEPLHVPPPGGDAGAVRAASGVVLHDAGLSHHDIRPVVTLVDALTGESAVADDRSLYEWTEGNGSCDCNRAAYFGVALPEDGLCAGGDRFLVTAVEPLPEGYTLDDFNPDRTPEATP